MLRRQERRRRRLGVRKEQLLSRSGENSAGSRDVHVGLALLENRSPVLAS